MSRIAKITYPFEIADEKLPKIFNCEICNLPKTIFEKQTNHKRFVMFETILDVTP